MQDPNEENKTKQDKNEILCEYCLFHWKGSYTYTSTHLNCWTWGDEQHPDVGEGNNEGFDCLTRGMSAILIELLQTFRKI